MTCCECTAGDCHAGEAEQCPEGCGPALRAPQAEATSDEVLGLLAYLDARSGPAEVFQIASELGCGWDRVIAAVKAAERLHFVSTPGPLVIVEPAGRRFLQSPAPRRLALLRGRLGRFQGRSCPAGVAASRFTVEGQARHDIEPRQTLASTEDFAER